MMTVKEYHDKIVARSLAGEYPCMGQDSVCSYFIHRDTRRGPRKCVVGDGLPDDVALAMERGCAGAVYESIPAVYGKIGFDVDKSIRPKDQSWNDFAKEHFPLSFRSAALLQHFHDCDGRNGGWSHDRFLSFLATIPEFAEFYESETVA